ncbi:unnamed protein product [Prorocentrum cordatum]|uniref:Uncharacterized protein n=1 Tax=Prorocentrum cordatum TaxID=2364126 RepID=A0ABN9SN44_9DINO|nr:unnamed protein product [Polarella glacialis]
MQPPRQGEACLKEDGARRAQLKGESNLSCDVEPNDSAETLQNGATSGKDRGWGRGWETGRTRDGSRLGEASPALLGPAPASGVGARLWRARQRAHAARAPMAPVGAESNNPWQHMSHRSRHFSTASCGVREGVEGRSQLV